MLISAGKTPLSVNFEFISYLIRLVDRFYVGGRRTISGKSKDPKNITSLIRCLSVLENDTSSLYYNLVRRVEVPLAKTLLTNIAQDSLKHSTLLEGIAHSLVESKETPKDCAKKVGEVWRAVETINKEIGSRKKITRLEFSQLSKKLVFLENALGEEYYIFVQMQTLTFLMKEINQVYDINLNNLKSIFESIIKDEEHHREILDIIKELFAQKEKKEEDENPMVKYLNPDSWSRSLPPNTHNST